MCAVKCVDTRIMTGMRNALANCALGVVERCARRPLLGAMTNQTDVLGQLRQEWRRVGRTIEARESLARLCRRHPELGLGRLNDLCEVVIALEASAATSSSAPKSSGRCSSKPAIRKSTAPYSRP
jgi:hypothetical protein